MSKSKSNIERLSLNVGLYPRVPRLDQFKTTIIEQWQKKHPQVKLNFIESWDGGYEEKPLKLDVFVFDAFYLDDYVNSGYLEALKKEQISDFDDLLPYAKDGVRSLKDDIYYGIPQIGCGTLLFYRENDIQLNQAGTLSQITNILGQCTYDTKIPPLGIGLMMDFSCKIRNSNYYIELIEGSYGKNITFSKPLKQGLLNTLTTTSISLLRQATSLKHALDANIKREELFSKGHGRAFVGYSESLSKLDSKTRQNVGFKHLSFSNNRNARLFYSDIAAINPRVVNKNMKEYAIELVNILTSTKTFVDATKGTKDNPEAQYLLPVRYKTFKAMSKQYPLYSDLHKLITDNKPKLFRAGVNVQHWVESNKEYINNQIFNSIR